MDLVFLDGSDVENSYKQLNEPSKYRDYLQTVSRFSGYSWRNILLIFTQMPNAVFLADFERWKNQYGRTIIQKSKSIMVEIFQTTK
jgi:hypothetical protein